MRAMSTASTKQTHWADELGANKDARHELRVAVLGNNARPAGARVHRGDEAGRACYYSPGPTVLGQSARARIRRARSSRMSCAAVIMPALRRTLCARDTPSNARATSVLRCSRYARVALRALRSPHATRVLRCSTSYALGCVRTSLRTRPLRCSRYTVRTVRAALHGAYRTRR